MSSAPGQIIPAAAAMESEPQVTEQAHPPVGSRGFGNIAYQGLSQLVLGIWAVIVIYPFVWMIYSSFKTERELSSTPFALPSSLQWDNFRRAWEGAQIDSYVVNTLIVLSMSVTGTILISAMAAYVLSRFEFRGRQLLFLLFTAGLMFPMFLGLVPLYFLMSDLHLRNTYHGLALVYIAYSLPFTIFFLIGFFKTLPGEVAEASIMDGASQIETFFKIMLPMAKPGLIAMAIFNFLGQWNQFLLPLVLMPTKPLISQGLNYLAIEQGYASDFGALFAAMTITMIPTLLIYIIFQRRLEAGLTAGALKG